MTKKLWGACVALVFLLAHLAFLPSSLEDVDSMNFALGLHDFDPAKHQPHPPGYPVFMALGKIARAVAPSDAAALALLGAVFGALAVFPLLTIFEETLTLMGHEYVGAGLNRPATYNSPGFSRPSTSALATLLVVASPLYWFNALRPMSDIPGLAVTLAAQAALISAFVRQRVNPARTAEALADSGTRIVLGAFLAALAIGMRSQAMWLTLPLLAIVLLQRVGRGAAGALLGSAMTFTIGIVLWAVPLIIASGGFSAYRAALNAQGGEDFTGVDMLYRNPTPRRLAFALLDTFITPWAVRPLGWIVFGLAAVGTLVMLLRARRVALLVAFSAVPYLLFHLLFQETNTTRYALPLLPFVVFLAVWGLVFLVRGKPAAVLAIAGGLAVSSLVVTLPATRIYAREGSPASAALSEVHRGLQNDPGAAIGMHQGLARSVRTQNFGRSEILPAPTMREWLELAAYWKAGKSAPVYFVADPARTDTELVDPLSRTLVNHYVWSFPREEFLGGIRPDIVDLIRIDSPPGWFAEDGWHLTPETLNMSERLKQKEATASIRPGEEPLMLVIGGESTATAGSGTYQVRLALDGRDASQWQLAPGQTFFDRLPVEGCAPKSAERFCKVVVSYAKPDGSAAPIRLTEFAVEPARAVFFVHRSGWNEIEYSRTLQRRWRWMTDSAVTFINNAGRDVTLTLAGESPLRYFDSPPKVTIKAGSSILATASPNDDFKLEVKIPADALRAADGMLTIETDKSFVPHERNGSPDRRTLGLRVWDFSISEK